MYWEIKCTSFAPDIVVRLTLSFDVRVGIQTTRAAFSATQLRRKGHEQFLIAVTPVAFSLHPKLPLAPAARDTHRHHSCECSLCHYSRGQL